MEKPNPNFFVDSQGKLIYNAEGMAFKVKNLDYRLKCLDEIQEEYKKIKPDEKPFIRMAEKEWCNEALIRFVKVPLDAAEPDVKRAFSSEISDDDNLQNYYNSIVQTEEKGKIKYYFVGVEGYIFERNLYDTNYVKITPITPCAAAEFIGEKLYDYIDEGDYDDYEYVLSIAQERPSDYMNGVEQYCINKDIKNDFKYIYPVYEEIAKIMCERPDYSMEGTHSNNNMLTMYYLRHYKCQKEVWDIFSDLKNFIRVNRDKGTDGIRIKYDNNVLTLMTKDKDENDFEVRLHIIKVGDSINFVKGPDKIYMSLDDLKSSILSGNLFYIKWDLYEEKFWNTYEEALRLEKEGMKNMKDMSEGKIVNEPQTKEARLAAQREKWRKAMKKGDAR